MRDWSAYRASETPSPQSRSFNAAPGGTQRSPGMPRSLKSPLKPSVITLHCRNQSPLCLILLHDQWKTLCHRPRFSPKRLTQLRPQLNPRQRVCEIPQDRRRGHGRTRHHALPGVVGGHFNTEAQAGKSISYMAYSAG